MDRRDFVKNGLFLTAAGFGGTGLAAAGLAPAGPAPFQAWRKHGVIFPPTAADIWDNNPSAPHVIQVGDKLRMYYEGRHPMRMPDGRHEFRLQIGAAEADLARPLDWRKVSSQPLLRHGEPGSIDSHWAGYPWVVQVTPAHWHMYYVGWGGAYRPDAPDRKAWRTTMAESDDGGLTWRKTGRAILPLGRPGACDEHGTGSVCVSQVGSEYWMWYTAIFQPRKDFYRISTALAVSRDGGHQFEPHPAGPVLNLPPVIGHLGSTCSKPFVRFHQGKFQMWFSCARDGLHYRVHYAESDDGICFRWHPEPVIDVSADGWDGELTCYPSVITVGDRTLMFYAGNNYVGIGAAELIVAGAEGAKA